jgi:DMSO/TMAO reductase YedYZ molybdopterin-dependent catalytic subunit
MADALHPQMLLAYAMNGGDLPVPFGGPLRLRVPRQLGYKSIKFINRLIVTDNAKRFGKGLGSASSRSRLRLVRGDLIDLICVDCCGAR